MAYWRNAPSCDPLTAHHKLVKVKSRFSEKLNTVCPREKKTQIQVQNSWTRFTDF